MSKTKYVAYLRVSTNEQGRSGLGLEAQRNAISEYIQVGKGERVLAGEFVEVESGKQNNRPQLRKALAACQKTGAILIIAKLDRLSRSLALIVNLMESGVQFVACDNPYANPFTIHILGATAQLERELISKRTKDALRAAKARGVRLGNPAGPKPEAIEAGTRASVAARKAKADTFAELLLPDIQRYQSEGLSLRAIAHRFNDDGIKTPTGKIGAWQPQTVKNILTRTAGGP